MARVMVVGGSGTVGLALAALTEQAQDIEFVLTDPREHLPLWEAMDAVVFCLPDAAAAELIPEVEQAFPHLKLLDASATHRCLVDWHYGLNDIRAPPEKVRKIANPGCFATGAILLSYPMALHCDLHFVGVTGYSAMGKKGAQMEGLPLLTGMGRAHRHLAEIERYGLCHPTLVPVVGPWERGMLVQTVIPAPVEEVRAAYAAAYRNSRDVDLLPVGTKAISPCATLGSNRVLIAAEPQGNQTLAVAAFDNLGKGSAGAAMANLRQLLELP